MMWRQCRAGVCQLYSLMCDPLFKIVKIAADLKLDHPPNLGADRVHLLERLRHNKAKLPIDAAGQRAQLARQFSDTMIYAFIRP